MVQKQPIAPFFSIITCTKNSSKFVRSCLDSVQVQTFRDFEHIIVDGNSTDDTLAQAEKYTNIVVASAPNGIANAMNHGIKRARGKYLYFLNSDDSFYDKSVLAKVHKFLLAHPTFDWVFGQIHETDGLRTIGYPPKRKIFQGKHSSLLKFYNYIPHQATFLKKSVFSKYGLFDESLHTMMDIEYWLRIAPHTDWGNMPIVVANYLIHPNSQSENPDHAADNNIEWASVQARYLSTLELVFANLINKLIR